VLRAYPFEPWAAAAEDLQLVSKATAAGYHATYNPAMVVKHHDVETVRAELRKNVREGEGWALYARDLGLHQSFLMWGALLGFAALLLALSPGVETLLLLLAALWLPALRRAARRSRDTPLPRLLLGVAASPPFDLAFLLAYLRGFLRARGEGRTVPLETNA
jgi:hypothetical protein